uniref:Uncharacterized protein n=1 Tax=Cucumis melo TaxID=3656 RepID=A0A9I9DNT7_CUCME
MNNFITTQYPTSVDSIFQSIVHPYSICEKEDIQEKANLQIYGLPYQMQSLRQQKLRIKKTGENAWLRERMLGMNNNVLTKGAILDDQKNFQGENSSTSRSKTKESTNTSETSQNQEVWKVQTTEIPLQ